MDSLLANFDNMNINKMFYKEETPVFNATIKHLIMASESKDINYVEYIVISNSINFAKYCIENNVKQIDLIGPDSNGVFFNYIEKIYGKSVS